ncbi:MAG: MarR family transcriptional regulator [Hyphomicrobiales bacterium]|nr:MarR family transcriptional regulator [Hyphomicrobiales bacterium]
MFDLSTFLPYLVNRSGVRLAVNFSQVLKPHGIGIQEWRVLAVLHVHGALRMSALAELTSIDRTTLSRLTARMQAAGLVERGRTEDDGREVRIGMTEKGQAITAQMLPHARHYEEVAVAGLSAEEVAALKDMLAKVYDNLDKL